MTPKWIFPPNNHGQRQGISDTGLESFKSKPTTALAREICQNSLDAGIPGSTVRIEFKMYDVERTSFPQIDEFTRILDRCIETWKEEKNHKTINILSKSREIAKSDKITFLRISDFNTTGLRGSDKIANSEWHNLVKSTGSSNKGGTTGGSYGIGKFATFVCSQLRTVFYSTQDIDGHAAFQGVSKLVSYNLDNPEDPSLESQGTGYYGEEQRLSPIKSCISLEPGYTRQIPGTDIYVAGYKEEFKENWDKIILREIIDNYFYAIYMGTLEVQIADILVNRNTLESIFQTFHDELSLLTIEYYKVLTSESTVWETIDFKDYGNVTCGILTGSEMTQKKVAMIRNPWMKIKDEGSLFDIVPYAGVLIIQGEMINAFLRKLENPSHTKWEVNLLEDPGERVVAKAILKDLRQFLIDQIKKAAGQQLGDEVELEGAADLIPLDEEDEGKQPSDTESLQPEVKDIETRVKKQPVKKKGEVGDSDIQVEDQTLGTFLPGEDVHKPEHGEGTYQGGDVDGDSPSGAGDGDQKVRNLHPIEINTSRFFCLDKSTSRYRIHIDPKHSAEECSISLYKLDDQGEREALMLTGATINQMPAQVGRNTISGFNVMKGQVQVIDFETAEMEYFSLEVELHGSQL